MSKRAYGGGTGGRIFKANGVNERRRRRRRGFIDCL